MSAVSIQKSSWRFDVDQCSQEERDGSAAALLIVAAADLLLCASRLGLRRSCPSSSAVMAQTGGRSAHHARRSSADAPMSFDGCPPEGKGGDPQLNLLKNRMDKGNYCLCRLIRCTR